jgi:hypothetical protein
MNPAQRWRGSRASSLGRSFHLPSPLMPRLRPRRKLQAFQKLTETETAAERAQLKAEAEAQARETLEQRLSRETQERALWEQLAQETEAAKLEIAARLAALQAQAEQAPKAEVADLVTRSEEAAREIDLDEADTRALIDQQLRDREWEADTKRLRFGEGARPAKGRNMAIAVCRKTRMTNQRACCWSGLGRRGRTAQASGVEEDEPAVV